MKVIEEKNELKEPFSSTYLRFSKSDSRAILLAHFSDSSSTFYIFLFYFLSNILSLLLCSFKT